MRLLAVVTVLTILVRVVAVFIADMGFIVVGFPDVRVRLALCMGLIVVRVVRRLAGMHGVALGVGRLIAVVGLGFRGGAFVVRMAVVVAGLADVGVIALVRDAIVVRVRAFVVGMTVIAGVFAARCKGQGQQAREDRQQGLVHRSPLIN